MKRKIVLVDDDRVTLTMLQMVLFKHGYKVFTAEDGQRGLELVQEIHPDVLITDMLLPKIDGLSLCKKIKESPELEKTKVIMITAVYKGISFRHEAEESGADAFVEKPIDTKKLISKIEALLGPTNYEKESSQSEDKEN
ncbi:MAG: PleD family two-component system response regulator [Candidatus Aminicenantales bacterium]